MSKTEKIHSIFDPNINFSDSSKYTLKILLEKLSLFVVLKEGNTVVAIDTFKSEESYFNNALLLKNIDYLAHPFAKTSIYLYPEKDTFVPTEGFDAQAQRDYMAFNFPGKDLQHISYDAIPNTDINIIYEIPHLLKSNIDSIFPNADITNAKSRLLSTFFNFQKKDEHVFLYVRKEAFDVFIFKNNSFVYGNSFAYKTSQDFTYFLMLAIKQLGLSPENLNLSLCGEIDKEGRIYEYIYKYIRNISFMSQEDDDVQFSNSLKDITFHYYYNILK